MGMFSPKDNTISDKEMASLSRRAQKADPHPWTSTEANDRRKASSAQAAKANQS